MAYSVPIRVRSYRSGDETSIMDGFNSVFGLERGSDYWRWKFLHHGAAIASVAVDDEHTVHAHIAAHPITWHSHRTQIFAAHAGDAFALPLSESIHSRAMVKTLFNLHKEQRSRGEIQLLFGFPSSTLSALHHTQSPLQDAPSVIKRWCLDRLDESLSHSGEYSVEIVIANPNSVDTFWQRVSARYALIAQRDWKWINWRFLQRPDVDNYEYLPCHSSAGTLRAWAVIRELDGCLWICDLLWDGVDTSSLEKLLRYIAHLALTRQLSKTVMWLQGDAAAIDVLKALGWRDDSQAHQVTLSMHPYDTSLDYDWLEKSLYITKADSDLI